VSGWNRERHQKRAGSFANVEGKHEDKESRELGFLSATPSDHRNHQTIVIIRLLEHSASPFFPTLEGRDTQI